MGRYYAVFMLCLTVFFLFADQNLMAPNLSAIANEFGFSDQERDEKLGGYVAFGFFVVGGPVALLVGYFTDSVNRCILFAVVITFGETACLGTYWIKTYEQLLICRILTGISIGGSTPIIFSILGDLFPENARVYVSTLIGIAMSAGIACGQLLAGTVGPAYGWRLPFLLVSIPAIISSILVMLTIKEPKRGAQEKDVRMLRHKIKRQKEGIDTTSDLPIPINKNYNTNTEIVESVNPLYFNINESVPSTTSTISEPLVSTASAFSPLKSSHGISSSDIEHGQITQTHHISNVKKQSLKTDDTEDDNNDAIVDYSEKIEWHKLVSLFSTPSVWIIFIQGFPGCLPWGMVYVFLNDYFSADRGMTVSAATWALTGFGIGGLFGMLLGGWYGQILYNRNPNYQCIFMGLSTILSVVPMLYILNTNTVGDFLFYFMAFIGGGIVSINGPNVRSVLQNVCIPEVRGCAFAVFMLTDDIGKGLGPALVVLLIKGFNGNRRIAFNVIVLFWLFCGIMLLCLVFFVHSDERAVSSRVKASLLRHSSVLRETEFDTVDIQTLNHNKSNVYNGNNYTRLDSPPRVTTNNDYQRGNNTYDTSQVQSLITSNNETARISRLIPVSKKTAKRQQQENNVHVTKSDSPHQLISDADNSADIM